MSANGQLMIENKLNEIIRERILKGNAQLITEIEERLKKEANS